MIDLALTSGKLKVESKKPGLLPVKKKLLEKYLIRETDLATLLIPYLETIKAPKIDAISVTYGPGLEPALWVGINCARALAAAWDLPIIPTNHMEGHIASSLINNDLKLKKNLFPAIALLISGGHTELVVVKNWLKYKILGQTRDDAVGEAFDKVARLLGLPYPGGPEISKLALKAGDATVPPELKLPRPMLHSGNFEFSFSGIKTSVLYKVRELEKSGPLSEEIKAIIAKEFQDAAIEVLTVKTLKALEQTGAKTLIIGGGVIANKALRAAFETKVPADVNLLIPEFTFTTDNASMIAVAAYFRYLSGKNVYTHTKKIVANGNLPLK